MSRARDLAATAETQKLVENLGSLGWYHSLRLPSGELIPGIQTEEQLRWRIEQFPIPQDLRGKRVLDIGAWDGWFSFEMERRGAEVVGVDIVDWGKFRQARELLGSKAEYHIIDDVIHLTPDKFGTFDIVLFFGVLYHLKHPLLALERVCALSTDLVCVESFVSDERLDVAPAMEFYEGSELCGQFDNWVGPNIPCLLAFCRTVGFARVKFESVKETRAHVTCWRKWPQDDRNEAARTGAAPRLLCVENSVSRNHSFSSLRDDYVSVWFLSDNVDLTCDNVYPEISGFGVRPAEVHPEGERGWLANFKLPPGLRDGVHAVRVAAKDSAWSNAVRIPVGGVAMPERGVSSEMELDVVCDGLRWDRNVVHTGANSCISLWVRGMKGKDAAVLLNGTEHPASYVSDPDEKGLTQVNALLPIKMPTGEYRATVAVGDAMAPPRVITLV